MGAGAYVELGAMQRARQQRSAQSTFGKLGLSMRAVIVHGVEFAAHPTHHHAVLSECSKNSNLSITKIAEITEFTEFTELNRLNRQ